MACLQRAVPAAILKFLLVAAIACGPLPAFAQFEEIVVRARKIEESLMEVPLSITALSSEQIERAGIVDLNDVAAFTPGLSFFSPIGEFLPTPIIRGVAQTQIFGETNVAIFVDGIYVAGREGLNFNFLDVERIETLKGPQSTLYGRNAFSGAINYVTKSVPDTFEVRTDGTVGNDGRLAGKIVVGGPILGDQLKGVISAGYDDFDGSYDDNIGGNDVGGREYKTYLGKLQWTPAANLDVTGTVYYSDDHIDIGPLASLKMNCEDIADPATSDVNSTRDAAFCGDIPELSELNNLLAAAGYPKMSGDNTVNKVKWGLGENRALTRGSLNINWDLDFGTFTWLSGYSKTKQKAIDDGTRNLANGQPFEYCPGGSFSCFGYAGVELALTGLPQPAGKDVTTEWSTELRYTSRQEEPLRGGGGFYYFDSQLKSKSMGSLIASAGLPPDYDVNTSRFGPFVGPPDFPLGTIAIGTPAFGPWFSENGDTDSSWFNGKTDTKSWASFGFLELDFLDDRFTARAEIRYTYQEEDKANHTINNGPPGCPSPAGLGCQDVNPTPPDPPGPNDGPNGVAYNFEDITQTGDGDWDFWTGRLSLQFRPNEDWMVYATVANGTKSGFTQFLSGNLITGEPYEAVLPVSNEKNTSYELGAKGTVADGKVQLEITGFYTDWSDAALRGTIDRDPNTGEL